MAVAIGRSGTRHVIAAVVAGLAAVGNALPALSQQRFDRLVSFGDSYADPNINILRLLFGGEYPSSGASPESLASAPYVAYPYWLQAQLGLTDEQMTSYAIAGSTTSPTNVVGGLPYSLPFQLAAAAGERYDANDLVTLSIGGNDGLRDSDALGAGFTPGYATTLAAGVSLRATQAVGSFADAGAQTIVALSFSDMTGLPTTTDAVRRDALRVYGQNLYRGMQENLVPLSQGGTRVFLLDLALLGQQVRQNLAGYGFGSYAYVPNAALPSVFGPDGLHLTSHGYEVMAQYISAALEAPYKVAASAGMAQGASSSFTASLFGRLDATRMKSADDGWTVYMLGTFANDAAAPGVDGDGFAGTLGAETQIDENWLAGVAVNLAAVNGDDNTESRTMQAAAYLSFGANGWFADALLSYGTHDLELAQSVLAGGASGDADADSISAAARGGYLFDMQSFQAGPVFGLRHTRTSVDAFGASGDPLLALDAESQTINSTQGDAGVEIRAPLALGGRRIDAFANIAWRHEFGDAARTVRVRLTQSPLLPIDTSVANFGSRGYGVLSAGFAADLTDTVSATLSASSTFARNGGNAFQIDAGFGVKF